MNSLNIVMLDSEFRLFQKMIYDTAGINMTEAKKSLISSRLAKRVRELGLASYAEYFDIVRNVNNGEQQIAIDLLTTNETSFFRESRHFDYLRDHVLPSFNTGAIRVWSAASSSGEEAYTISMMLAEHCPVKEWAVVGTDISTRIVKKAREAKYPMNIANSIPEKYLKKYCLKGVSSQYGAFLIAKELRSRVEFVHANLTSDLARLGSFDVIFLRNVLIYFDTATKKRVIDNVCRQLKPGGFIMFGHSESVTGVTNYLTSVAPSIYIKKF
jgi:chemotaxis protein methyltransferase CheR